MVIRLKMTLLCGLVLSGLLLGLAACQLAIGPEGNQSQSETPVEAATPNQTGLTGTIMAASDVSGQPDEPLSDQMILAVPLGAAEDLLGINAEQLTDQQLRFLRADLSESDPRMTVTLSDPAGKYSLFLESGEYILCVANTENQPPDFPARTRGCGRVQVFPGKMRGIDISSGFGEILLLEN